MLILAVDTSSKYCSAAVYRDGEIVSDLSVNNGKTHSRCLCRWWKQALSLCGSGSFRRQMRLPARWGRVRLRAFALRWRLSKRFRRLWESRVSPSTHCGRQAYNILDAGALVCPILDARCGQVYAAVYDGGREVYPVSALVLEELCDYLSAAGER